MSWEHTFLSWFASQRIPMAEVPLELGSLRYYRFSSAFTNAQGKQVHSMGCSPDRETAAVKCAAETIERKFMGEFFRSHAGEIPAHAARISADGIQLLDVTTASVPPKGLRTSNGWALHSSAERACENAWSEALERHLLIKSFYRWGWAGFRLIREFENEDVRLFLMTSRLRSAGHVAGIVGAKWPNYPGASFGYCIGRIDQVHDATFWHPAIFEATTRVQLLRGKSIEVQETGDTWLQGEAKYFLETPLDPACFREGQDTSPHEDGERTCFIKSFDLARSWDLNFPFAVAFCWGGNLIPLCDQSSLDLEGKEIFKSALRENDLPCAASERQPIL